MSFSTRNFPVPGACPAASVAARYTRRSRAALPAFGVLGGRVGGKLVRPESHETRREFVVDVGRLASAAVLPATLVPAIAAADPAPRDTAPGAWDLSWLDRLAKATDRAVFDWPSLGDPADPSVFMFAARYLDNCDAVYGPGKAQVGVVLNIRTQAVPVALNDALWEKYKLGTEYNTKDPNTQQPATRNPFCHRAPSPGNGYTVPTLGDFIDRGAFFLVCDFALGHLSKRLADKAGSKQEDVRRELRAGFVPNAYAVPSGIYGLAKAQNAGCALIRL